MQMQLNEWIKYNYNDWLYKNGITKYTTYEGIQTIPDLDVKLNGLENKLKSDITEKILKEKEYLITIEPNERTKKLFILNTNEYYKNGEINSLEVLKKGISEVEQFCKERGWNPSDVRFSYDTYDVIDYRYDIRFDYIEKLKGEKKFEYIKDFILKTVIDLFWEDMLYVKPKIMYNIHKEDKIEGINEYTSSGSDETYFIDCNGYNTSLWFTDVQFLANKYPIYEKTTERHICTQEVMDIYTKIGDYDSVKLIVTKKRKNNEKPIFVLEIVGKNTFNQTIDTYKIEEKNFKLLSFNDFRQSLNERPLVWDLEE